MKNLVIAMAVLFGTYAMAEGTAPVQPKASEPVAAAPAPTTAKKLSKKELAKLKKECKAEKAKDVKACVAEKSKTL